MSNSCLWVSFCSFIYFSVFSKFLDENVTKKQQQQKLQIQKVQGQPPKRATKCLFPESSSLLGPSAESKSQKVSAPPRPGPRPPRPHPRLGPAPPWPCPRESCDIHAVEPQLHNQKVRRQGTPPNPQGSRVPGPGCGAQDQGMGSQERERQEDPPGEIPREQRPPPAP